MERRVAVVLALTAACGSPTTTTVVAGDAPAGRPYRDLPDVPRRTIVDELPQQYELPTTTTTTQRRGPVRSSRSAPPRPRLGASAPLACIRSHESNTSGGYRAVSANGLWFGAYQFTIDTWSGAVRRAGYPEFVDTRPDRAPAEVQDAAARQLFAERGLQPWPPARNCA